MRRHTGDTFHVLQPDSQASRHIRVGQAAAALGEEEGALARIAGERTAAALQVAFERPAGGLADRQQPHLVALAEHPQLVFFPVEGVDVEVDDLLAAQPAGVGELEHRPVAQLQRCPRRDPLQQRAHLVAAQYVRQLLRTLRAGDQLGRVAADLLGADEEVVEAADRGEVAGDRGRGLAGAGERGGVAAHVAMAEVAGAQATCFGPGGEGGEVDTVGAPGALPRAPSAQVTVISGECRIPVHGCPIRARCVTPCAFHDVHLPEQTVGRTQNTRIYPIKTGVPTSTSSYSSSTSGMDIRTHPWEAALPRLAVSSVPWIPAPS